MRLTTKAYWSGYWDRAWLPARIDLKSNYSYRILDRVLRRHLGRGQALFEIGCAPGAWQDYFHRRYGHVADGIEYSKKGYELAIRNQRLLGFKGQIKHGDIFDYRTSRRYDVVFSFGFIEHFTCPSLAIREHARLLRKGGRLVVVVPNIKKAFYGPLEKLLNPKSYRGYIHISRETLGRLMQNQGFRCRFLGYAGVFNLGLINTQGSSMPVGKIFGWANRLANLVLSISRPHRESGTFSPYIVYIGTKK
jgi:cyclopropane fatty-acyl-phospholipid synthase-like methyltransferase